MGENRRYRLAQQEDCYCYGMVPCQACGGTGQGYGTLVVLDIPNNEDCEGRGLDDHE